MIAVVLILPFSAQ